MPITLVALELVGGITYLLIGSDLIVRGSLGIARRFGIAPFVAGLTIVSLGSTAPELVIASSASLSEHSDIALGNVVGCNIANVLLVIGLPAMIFPLKGSRPRVRLPALLMLGASVMFVALSVVGPLGRADGAILLLGAVLVLGYYLGTSTPDRPEEPTQEFDRALGVPESLKVLLLLIGVGSLLLMFGANLVVDGAAAVALRLSLPNSVIGVTVLAIGTSLPELSTMLMAAAKKEHNLAVGNVIGSNLFNLLLVMGASVSISPSPIHVPSEFIIGNMSVMLGSTLVLVVLIWRNSDIGRWTGLLFVLAYIGYVFAQLRLA